MAFKRVKSLTGAVDPFEFRQMTNNEGATLGEALVETNGKLTKCGADKTPEYIAEATVGAATPGAFVPVSRVREDVEYETTATATVAATVIGSKVTLHTDGLQVTATTTNGVFYVTGTDGVTGGGVVRGMFRR